MMIRFILWAAKITSDRLRIGCKDVTEDVTHKFVTEHPSWRKWYGQFNDILDIAYDLTAQGYHNA